MRNMYSVDLIRHVCFCDKPQKWQLDAAFSIGCQVVKVLSIINVVKSLLLCHLYNVFVIVSAASLGAIRQKVAAPSSQDQVHHSSKWVMAHQLLRNQVFI